MAGDYIKRMAGRNRVVVGGYIGEWARSIISAHFFTLFIERRFD